MTMPLTPEQLHTLRHMLGINTPLDRVPMPYRNYAAATPGDPEFIILAEIGAVELYRPHGPGTEYDWYQCTEAGKKAAVHSHRKIRKKKSQRKYSAFLELKESFPHLTYLEFLTSPKYSEIRRNA